jgi:hypothetical protein
LDPVLTRHRALLLQGQRGIGLMEIMVATVITVIAVVALAYAFGNGRGLVDRFAEARVALSVAHRRMELLSSLPAAAAELAPGYDSGSRDVVLDGRLAARERWRVALWDDPVDPAHGTDLKQVWVTVTWGSGSADTVGLHRFFPLQ